METAPIASAIQLPSKSWTESAFLFLTISIVFCFGFAMLISQSSAADIIAHWADRRCDLDVMMSAFYYKPADDIRSASQFTTDNFTFCVGSKTETYLHSLFGSLFEVLRKQMGAADIMTEVMTSLKTSLSSIYTPFSKLMGDFFNKFKQIGALGSRVFQHLYMSMKKATGIAVASVFIGLSLQTALLNTVDFLINVIMIVLYIMIALAVIFFFPILPVMAMVYLAVNGIEMAIPGRTGSMGAVFCFDESTRVVLQNGTTLPINEIKVGDILRDGQVVEAHIELMGPLSPLYVIDGVEVSGDHRIWSAEKRKWILVKNHPSAYTSSRHPDLLWTLITSNREIPVQGVQAIQRFADWEELPDTDENAVLWDRIVTDLFGQVSNTQVPNDPPVLSGGLHVKKFQAGWIPLCRVQQGDWIMGENRWTKVLGVCHRQAQGGIGEKESRITDGVWIKEDTFYPSWVHSTKKSDTVSWLGYHLITEEGVFRIRGLDTSSTAGTIVRDFTEVGWWRLPETYTRVEKSMSRL